MKTFISILRGINVSGAKKILMTDLKSLYEGLRFTDVITYIQSGNVVFRSASKLSDNKLAQQIEQAISKYYNFEVPVIIRSVEETKQVIDVNPFLKDKTIDLERLHVTFLSETPVPPALQGIKKFDYPPDKFIIMGTEVFLYCPVSYGETKLSNKFFENKLKVTATTRNWKTVNKLYEIASGI